MGLFLDIFTKGQTINSQEMNFGVIQLDVYYSSIPGRIRYHVPGFNSFFEDTEIYLLLFEFGGFVVQNRNDDVIRKSCITFLNEAIELGRYKTTDAIVLEVFHQLYELPDALRIIRNDLSEKALALFDKSHSDYCTINADDISDC